MKRRSRRRQIRSWARVDSIDPAWQLDEGSRVAVVGGGPAGSFSTIFLIDTARRAGFSLDVDLFEPRSFDRGGPAGCNHCGGIVSESLVQALASDGINLPPSVVQRGIESYQLHMDIGSVEIESPVEEQRIAAVYRGNGPRGGEDMPWESFDGFLQRIATGRGANIVPQMVTSLDVVDERRWVETPRERHGPYDLVVLASGVNSNLATSWGDSPATRPVETARTYISEFKSDADTIHRKMGNSMHVFMIDVPGVEFAALIPKGDYITFAMLGHGIDPPLVESYLAQSAVRRALPFEWIPCVCSCTPLINVRGPSQAFGDRIVMVGDSGVTRLYKDGIGASYRTAKAAASAAVLFGVSEAAFRDHYQPVCSEIAADNRYGKALFAVTWLFRKVAFLRRAVLRMTRAEQRSRSGSGVLSRALWNLFTGSAPYREVFWSTLRPWFLLRLLGHAMASLVPPRREREEVHAEAQG